MMLFNAEFVQVCNFWFFVCFGWQLEEVKPQSIIQSATSATIAETATGTYTIVLGNSFPNRIIVIHTSNRYHLWTAPVATGKSE
jgi:hypothetical protein